MNSPQELFQGNICTELPEIMADNRSSPGKHHGWNWKIYGHPLDLKATKDINYFKKKDLKPLF